MEEELQLSCPQIELSILGTLFKNNIIFFSYMDLLKNDDFADGNTRFWHIFLSDYILTYSNEVTSALCNTFASMSETRLKGYRKFGGFTTIKEMMNLALDEEDFQKAVNTLKKYSLLRKLHKEGFDVEPILGHSKFNSMNAETCANLVRAKIDTVCNNVITGLDQPSSLTSDSENFINNFFVQPSRGWNTPFSFMNDYMLGLCPGDTLAWIASSNSGKGRSISALSCYLSLVAGATTYVLENEMDEQRWKQSIITHCCNDASIQKLTGCNIHIPEKRIVLSSYLDDSTQAPIYRLHDAEGNYTESVENFIQRVKKNSSEYNQVIETMRYIDQHGKNKMLFKQVGGCYDDSNITRLMSQAVLCSGTDILIYDTMKPVASGMDKWSTLQQTATVFQETIQKLKKASAICTLQMDRSAIHKRIEEITQDNIAMSSQIFHLMDSVIMWKHIEPEDMKDYVIRKYDKNFAEEVDIELDPKNRYVGFKLTKNRRGSKGDMFCVKVNLNENTWIEQEGILVVKKPRSYKDQKKDQW